MIRKKRIVMIRTVLKNINKIYKDNINRIIRNITHYYYVGC